MKRRQFTNLLAERAGLKKYQAEEFIRVFPEVLAEVLLEENKVKLMGLGIFELRDIPERIMRRKSLNGTDGIETYEMGSYKRIGFRASDPLYEKVNGSKRRGRVKKNEEEN